jgi:uncharacterized MAPEG superfamily protein
MTIAYWCVLIAALLPIVWAGVAKAGGGRRYDNARPREFLAALDGYRQRANWAQQNSYETYAFFAAGVIIAHLAGAAQSTVDALAVTFVIARVAYGIFYIADRSTLRSLTWLVAFGCTVGLFVAAA